jgi:hypothetical protein
LGTKIQQKILENAIGSDMIGRNKHWQEPSDWMNEFNRVHNPDYYYGKKKTKKKKTSRPKSTKRHPVFKVED